MFDPAYIGVATVGLLHGLEPGHGWPVAVLYSTRRKSPALSAILAAGVIGAGHLVSSIAVVAAYVLLQMWFDFRAVWIKYLSAAILFLLALKLFREKTDELGAQHDHIHGNQPAVEHEHEHAHPEEGKHSHWHKHVTRVALSLWSLISFAFVLGFAHEEEFALLALVAGGVNAWILMLSYAIAVLVGLVAVTVSGVKVYEVAQRRLIRFERYVPKISAAVLALMAVVIIFW